MMVSDDSLARLESRFGSFEGWATRVTKNGIMMRTESLAEHASGERARVALLVLFNDGTRRHDNLDLFRDGDTWKVAAASVPGAP